MTDEINLKKKDGRMFIALKASVQKQHIYPQRTDVPFEEDDIIERTLPNGMQEKYSILEANYCSSPFANGGSKNISSHYELTVRKHGSLLPDGSVKFDGCKISQLHLGSGDNKKDTK